MKQGINFTGSDWHFYNDGKTIRVDVDIEKMPDGSNSYHVTRCYNDDDGTICGEKHVSTEAEAKRLVALWTK